MLATQPHHQKSQEDFVKVGTILAGILALVVGSHALAAGDAGCGLGSVVIKKNSKLMQLFAITTNGTFSSQFFGITSGTSNCSASGLVQNDRNVEVFVAANQQDLSNEMARGQGEKLSTLATLNGCGSLESQKVFASMTQKSYEKIMTSSEMKSEEIVTNLKKAMQDDSAVAQLCHVAAL